MNNNLLYDFNVDKATKTVVITREFAAELPLVWDAFTKPELLDQWIAPKPFAAKTKHANFAVGGKRFYAMCGPDGQAVGWILQTYTSISPKTNYKMFNVFADADENPHEFGSDWDFTFSEEGGKTKVVVSIYNESLERLEKMLEMGFTEGFTSTLINLDEMFETLSLQK